VQLSLSSESVQILFTAPSCSRQAGVYKVIMLIMENQCAPPHFHLWWSNLALTLPFPHKTQKAPAHSSTTIGATIKKNKKKNEPLISPPTYPISKAFGE